MSLTLRWRLTIGIAASIIITLVLALVILWVVLANLLGSEVDSNLEGNAGLISARVTLLGSLDEPERLQEIVESYSVGEPGHVFSVVIRDKEGRVLAASPGLPTDEIALSGTEMNEVLAGKTVGRSLQVGEGDDVRLRSSRLSIGRDVVGIVQVVGDAELIERVLDRLRTVLLAAGVGGVLLAMVIGFWLARGAVKPLEEVIRVAADIEASDLGRRIEARGSPAEVQRLADTFDAMLERLETAFEQQRNFVLDMSHELRTPLTTLRGNLDVMLMDKGLDAETRASLERMLGEVSRMIRLTQNLLYMARAEAGRELDRRPVELDTLCLEIYRQTKDLRADLTFRLGNEDEVTVIGDRDLLKQMLLNLVDNSLKYTPSGGQVSLSLYREDSTARVDVSDTGPGIPPEQIPLIFKRYYRGTNREQGLRGGAGIGLAITDWIAKAHGGAINVSSEPGKGSVFTVMLPLEPERGGQETPDA